MGVAERKEREKQQRRNDIIDAAEKVFFSKGFTNSTMDDVAEEAELSKGTLYLYFKSKEELFHEIAGRGEELLEKYFKKAIKNKRNGIKKVRAIGEAFIKFFMENREYHEAMLFGHTKKDFNVDDCEDCNEKKYKSNDVFVNTIIEGIEDGSIRKDLDPEITAFLLWGHTMGVLQLVSSKGEMIKSKTGKKPEELMKHSLDFNYSALEAKSKE